MSIMTKTGDGGTTGLWSGERVSKSDARVEAYGTVDELNSFLGEAKHHLKTEGFREIIEQVQRELFKLGGELASTSADFIKPLTKADIDKNEKLVKEFESQVSLDGFVLPGSSIASAKMDIARTVCRRAERRITGLALQHGIRPELRQFINRLSDLLYIMARIEEKECLTKLGL